MKNTVESSIKLNYIAKLEAKVDWNLFGITAIWIYLFLTFFCILA